MKFILLNFLGEFKIFAVLFKTFSGYAKVRFSVGLILGKLVEVFDFVQVLERQIHKPVEAKVAGDYVAFDVLDEDRFLVLDFPDYFRRSG